MKRGRKKKIILIVHNAKIIVERITYKLFVNKYCEPKNLITKSLRFIYFKYFNEIKKKYPFLPPLHSKKKKKYSQIIYKNLFVEKRLNCEIIISYNNKLKYQFEIVLREI